MKRQKLHCYIRQHFWSLKDYVCSYRVNVLEKLRTLKVLQQVTMGIVT